jgi:hypothetical protein
VKERTGSAPAGEDVQVNWGRHADGGDYWEILCRDPEGSSRLIDRDGTTT